MFLICLLSFISLRTLWDIPERTVVAGQ